MTNSPSRMDVKAAFPESYTPKGIEASLAQAARKTWEPLTLEGFIEALFGRTAGFIRLRAFHPVTKKQETAVVRGHEAVRKFAEKWKDTHDIYFSVATTKYGNRSTRTEVVELVTAHVDVDVHDKAKQSPAFGRIIDFQPTPHIVIFSGGGFHCYWLFDTPMGPEGINKVENINRKLSEKLGGDSKATDCVRLLRLPETINHKPEYDKPTVDVVFCLTKVYGRLT